MSLKRFLFILIPTLLFFLPFYIRPIIFLGDEPHYLVAINSILLDHDLDLTNNYLATGQAGVIAQSKALPDHHTVFIKPNEPPILWRPHSDYPLANLMKTQQEEFKERPVHAISFIFIYSILTSLLTPFMNAEQAVLIVSQCIGVASLGIFFLLARKYLREKTAYVATLFLAFGTSFWYYSHTLFPEVCISFFLLLSVLLFLEKKALFLCGILCGVLISIKTPYGIPLLIYSFSLYTSREYTLLKQLLSGTVITGVIYMIANYAIYADPLFLSTTGNLFQPIQVLLTFTPWISMYGMLFSLHAGLFVFTPLLLFSFIQIGISLLKKDKKMNLFTVLSLLTIGFYSFWSLWDGGYSFSYRLIVPMIPFLVLFAFYYIQEQKNLLLQITFYTFLILSFAIQVSSIWVDPVYVNSSPPILFMTNP